jgi:hypothetical protein
MRRSALDALLAASIPISIAGEKYSRNRRQIREALPRFQQVTGFLFLRYRRRPLTPRSTPHLPIE